MIAGASSEVTPTMAAGEEVDFRKIFQLIEGKYGVDFNKYKIATVRRRIERRIDAIRIKTLAEYASYLESRLTEITTNIFYQFFEAVSGMGVNGSIAVEREAVYHFSVSNLRTNRKEIGRVMYRPIFLRNPPSQGESCIILIAISIAGVHQPAVPRYS